MVDPLGALIVELRNANIAGGRVRGGEPAPKAAGYEGDALGPGHFKRFVVLVRLGADRLHRTPVATHRIGVRAYGATYQDAAALYGEISDLLDNAGPRLTNAGVAIYQSLDISGGNAERDPDTSQPFEVGVIELIAGTAVVAT
jgi:hypothetical protein